MSDPHVISDTTFITLCRWRDFRSNATALQSIGFLYALYSSSEYLCDVLHRILLARRDEEY